MGGGGGSRVIVEGNLYKFEYTFASYVRVTVWLPEGKVCDDVLGEFDVSGEPCDSEDAVGAPKGYGGASQQQRRQPQQSNVPRPRTE